jgi:hypothetical protein
MPAVSSAERAAARLDRSARRHALGQQPARTVRAVVEPALAEPEPEPPPPSATAAASASASAAASATAAVSVTPSASGAALPARDPCEQLCARVLACTWEKLEESLRNIEESPGRDFTREMRERLKEAEVECRAKCEETLGTKKGKRVVECLEEEKCDALLDCVREIVD